MSEVSLAVIDDFYDDPERVRDAALTASFDKPAWKYFPGREAVVDSIDWSGAWERMRASLGVSGIGPNPRDYAFPQGKFNLAVEADEDTRGTRVHVDLNRWAGVIYLSRPADCRGGTSWYRHKATGALTDSGEWHDHCFGHLAGQDVDKIRTAMLQTSLDRSQWEEIARIEMRFNRAVVFMSQTFHATSCLFGDRPENARLSQHFEFYTDD